MLISLPFLYSVECWTALERVTENYRNYLLLFDDNLSRQLNNGNEESMRMSQLGCNFFIGTRQ